MQLFERLCATFLHTMPHLFPPAVSIVVKMSSPHCRMQKEGGFLMRLPWLTEYMLARIHAHPIIFVSLSVCLIDNSQSV